MLENLSLKIACKHNGKFMLLSNFVQLVVPFTYHPDSDSELQIMSFDSVVHANEYLDWYVPQFAKDSNLTDFRIIDLAHKKELAKYECKVSC